MQSVDIRESQLALLKREEEFARMERLGKVHHQHLGNGSVRLSKVYTGTRDRDIHEAMDQDLAVLKAHGAENVRRTRIGRNTPCPCGSGRKFKKCCIPLAQKVAR
jgi:uncharacterized protein YecA (UPF0149 family)